MASAGAGVLIKVLVEVNKSSAQFQSGGIISSAGRGSCWQETNASTCEQLIKLHRPRGVCKSKSQKSWEDCDHIFISKDKNPFVCILILFIENLYL